MRQYGEARYAVCREHVAVALAAMDGCLVEVRRVLADPVYRCHCGEEADFFLLEVES